MTDYNAELDLLLEYLYGWIDNRHSFIAVEAFNGATDARKVIHDLQETGIILWNRYDKPPVSIHELTFDEWKKRDWSKHDKRINNLTGFAPADREKRECTSCGKKGHYYYECNDGAFLNLCDGLVEGLKIISNE